MIVQEKRIDPLDRPIDPEMLSTTSEVSLLPKARLEVVRFQLDDIILWLGDRLTDTALRSYVDTASFPSPLQHFITCSMHGDGLGADVRWTADSRGIVDPRFTASLNWVFNLLGRAGH